MFNIVTADVPQLLLSRNIFTSINTSRKMQLRGQRVVHEMRIKQGAKGQVQWRQVIDRKWWPRVGVFDG